VRGPPGAPLRTRATGATLASSPLKATRTNDASREPCAPAKRKGWGIDDQRTTAPANQGPTVASGGAIPRRPLPPTPARKCYATCEQRRLQCNGRRRHPQTGMPVPTNSVQRADCENRTPTPQPVFFLTQRNASVLSNGLRLTCRPPWTTLHRPAARCEAATSAQRTDPAAGRGNRQPKAAGGQVQPIVRHGMAKMPNRLPSCSAKPRPQTLPYQPAPAAPTRAATNAAGPTPGSDHAR